MKLIRSLGLALLTCAALMGFTSVASASHLLQNEVTPATLHGTKISGEEFYSISVGSFSVLCEGVSFESQVTGHELTAFRTSSVSNGSCSSGSVFKMNGCRLEFQPGAADRFNIGPNGCGAATLELSGCVVSIGPQAGLPATYLSTEGMSKTGHSILINPENVLYTTSKCGVFGLPASGSNLKLNIKWNVTETEAGGGLGTRMYFEPWAKEVPLQQSYCCGAQPGLFMQGETFDAQSFPVEINGTYDHLNSFHLEVASTKATAECETASFSGGELSGPAGELHLSGNHSNCRGTYSESGNSFDYHGCKYRLYSAKPFEGAIWHGEADLQCPAGKSAELYLANSQCRINIPAQHLSGVQVFEDEGSGTGAAIDASLTAEGLKYTREYLGKGAGILCKAFAPSEGSDLKLSDGIRLTGIGIAP